MATFVYCSGLISSVHVNSRYGTLCERYGKRLRKLSYSYNAFNNRLNKMKVTGGVTVCDSLGKKPSHLIFEGGDST